MENNEFQPIKPPLPPEDDLRFQNLRSELQKAVNNSERRAQLEKEFPWVKVISDDPHDRDTTCVQYTFGPGEIGERNAEQVYEHGEPIEDRKFLPGDYVFYKNQEGDVVHVGRIQEDGMIESKWGKGPVVVSPLKLVPIDYGDTVLGFRFTKKNEGDTSDVSLPVGTPTR